LAIFTQCKKTWAISKGLKQGDGKLKDFMKVDMRIPKVQNQVTIVGMWASS
jgi:hypothetical protein